MAKILYFWPLCYPSLFLFFYVQGEQCLIQHMQMEYTLLQQAHSKIVASAFQLSSNFRNSNLHHNWAQVWISRIKCLNNRF